ncbi:SRPBCC family protein [Belliella marina]|uniref:SRPBCC family protein n=1 Tax=Belliella marina TaxID=1644146 RepID=A0ABW4VR18_9BACT
MKVLKTIGVILALVIAIPLLVALITTKEIKVVREIVIDQPKQVVFDYVKYLKNQQNYSKWDSMDPEMEKSFYGIDGEVGFIYAWKSVKPDVGVGEQEILAIDPGKRIDYALRFKEPFEASDFAYLELQKVTETQTKVVWGYDGTMKYPMNAMLWFLDMDKMVGDDFAIGLKNLKEILEK